MMYINFLKYLLHISFFTLTLYFKVLFNKMTQTDYLKDITEIRSLMERSSRFISLSGLSGIMAGIYALIGAWIAYQLVYQPMDHIQSYRILEETNGKLVLLIIDGMVVLMLAIATGLYLTIRRTKKMGLKVWDQTSKRLIINLLIPLFAGGILVLILMSKGFLGLVAPVTLIFYGLALINASKYTLSDIRYLGITETALGLLASYFIGYGLLFWAIGFGLLHIIYGVVMYSKYEK